MTVLVECPNCGGKAWIPRPDSTDFTCPECNYANLASRPLDRTASSPSESVAPAPWKLRWGAAFTIIGGLAFVVGAISEYSASPDPPLVAVVAAGLLNPVFLIGVPLGVYWLHQSRVSHPLAAIAGNKPTRTAPHREQEQLRQVSAANDGAHHHQEKVQWGRIGAVIACICLCCYFLRYVKSQPSGAGSSSVTASARAESQQMDSGLRGYEASRMAYGRVMGLLAAERYMEAMDACNNEIAVNPDGPYFSYARGVIRQKTGDLARGVIDLDLAVSKIEAMPASPGLDELRLGCLAKRAFCCLCLGLKDRAWIDVNEVIRADPNNAWGFNFRGLMREGLGDNKGALDDISVAMKLAPTDTVYQANYHRVARLLTARPRD